MKNLIFTQKTLDLIFKNNKKRLIKFNSLKNDELKNKYVMSCLGLYQDCIHGVNTQSSFVYNKRPGTILELYQKRFTLGGFTKPQDNLKYIGVEIECVIPGCNIDFIYDENDDEEPETLCCYNCDGDGALNVEDSNGYNYHVDCAACDGSGEVENEDYRGNSGNQRDRFFSGLVRKYKISGLNVKSDSSIDVDSDGDMAVELNLLMRQGDFTALERTCKMLNDLEAYVNSSCGLHIHIDAREILKNKGEAKLTRRLEKSLPFVNLLVPKSRLKSNYCVPRVSKTDRYSTYNLVALSKYSTVEVRSHSGTTNFLKIKNWILLQQSIVNLESSRLIPLVANGRPLTKLIKFLKSLSLDNSVVEFFINRAKLFNNLEEGEDLTDLEEDEKLEEIEENENLNQNLAI